MAGVLVLMIVTGWQLALAVLALGPAMLMPIALFGRRVQRLARASQDRLAEASARAGESLRAVRTIQLFSREGAARAGFTRAVDLAFDAAMRQAGLRALMTALGFAAIFSGLVAVLWYGASRVAAGAITPGAMVQFVLYAVIAVGGAGVLSEAYAELRRAAGLAERLAELLTVEPEITSPRAPVPLPHPLTGAIGFESVLLPTRDDPIARRCASCRSRSSPGRQSCWSALPAPARARCSSFSRG